MAGTAYTLYNDCNGGCGSGNAVCNPIQIAAAPRCSCVNFVASNNVASGLGYSFGSDQIRLFDGTECSVCTAPGLVFRLVICECVPISHSWPALICTGLLDDYPDDVNPRRGEPGLFRGWDGAGL